MPVEALSMDARQLLSEPLGLVQSFAHLPVTSLPAAIHEVHDFPNAFPLTWGIFILTLSSRLFQGHLLLEKPGNTSPVSTASGCSSRSLRAL